METSPKRCLNGITGDQMSNFAIKPEVEWMPEDSYAPDLAYHEVGLDMESMRCIKTEEDPYHTDAEAHAVQEFTPVPQTDKLIKAELILDEEFRDKMSDSEQNCKQPDLAIAGVQQPEVRKSDKQACGSSHTQKANLTIQTLANHLDKIKSIIPFECEFCSRSFNKKYNLTRHINTHHAEEFPSDLYERNSTNILSLKSHTKTSRAKLKASIFICEVCGSSFNSRRNLKIHVLRKHLDGVQSTTSVPQIADDSVNTHTGEFLDEATTSYGQSSQKSGRQDSESISHVKSEACEVCHCIYPTEYIRLHMSLTHSKRNHKCELCPRLFKEKSHLEKHLRTHATNRKREFACDLCEMKFYSQASLINHMKVYAQRDHPIFKCEVCESSFTKKGDLDVHMLTKHLDQSHLITPAPQTGEDGKREFPCDLCKRKFYSNLSLKRHEKIHTTLNRSNFSCEECGSSFAGKNHLKIHMLRKHLERVQSKTSGPQTAADDSIDTHTKEFLATEAASYGQASRDSAALRSNSKSDTKSETCEVCDCIFPTEYIRIHKRLAHSKPKYKCQVCLRLYKDKSHLVTHLRTHATNRKREFACDLCGKTFYTKRYMWDHKKVHTQDMYHCKVCNQGFKQKESLKVHILRRRHFDETQQFTPQPSNDAGVPMKTELTSDEEEEFIDEGKYRAAVSHAEGSQQPTLTADEKQSVGGDSHSCQVCQKSYPGELIDTHMRMTHDDETHKCPFCPRMFLTKSELKNHIRSHDNKDKRPAPYDCEQCGHKFTTKRSVKRHMATQHTKNRIPEFNCELCEKKFYTKQGLKEHERTHTAVTFSCAVCVARFKHKASLKYHMLHKHTAKTQHCRPDPPAANDDSVHTKEELTSDQEFLDEAT